MASNPYKEEHENISGPGDRRPTANQVIADQGLVNKMGGIVILITGATSGLGVETAKTLRATGADIYITARSGDKAAKTIDEIRASATGSGKIDAIVMELDSFESIKAGAADFLKKTNKLNILINNAGVMACPEGTTKDGYETQFGTNHLGHFLLFQLLKSTLLASSTPSFNSRVISVSSSGHRITTIHFDDYDLKKDGYNPMTAYGQSKIANIYFANELERQYGARGLHAWSLHPGAIETNLGKHLDPKLIASWKSNTEMMKKMKSPEQGAATQVWAAVAKELEGRGGKYLDDVGIAGPMGPNPQPGASGYASYAYDEAAEKRLWVESLKMVGMTNSE